MNDEVLVRQKAYGMGFFSVWLMIITSVQWTLLDMYLPALPVICREFGVSETLLNVSLNMGIIFSAAGTFIGGVLSDRYGRKSILLTGLFLSSICSFLCVIAHGVTWLCIMRGVAGLGSGFVLSVTMAVFKDSFTGKRFQRNMTILQSVAVVGPIIAPVLGTLLITIASWQGIFWFLGAAVGVTMLPILVMTETWPKEERTATDFRALADGAAGMVKNRGFMLFLCIMSFLIIPVWAYLGVSSYVYFNDFGLSNGAFSFFYAMGAFASFLAPFVYLMVERYAKTRTGVTAAIGVLLAGCIILLSVGRLTPVFFLLGVVPIMMAEGIIRPLGTIVLLEEYKDQAGTASAWVQFIVNGIGVVGTSLATLPWQSYITGVGIIAGGCVIGAVICWIVLFQGRYIKAFHE